MRLLYIEDDDEFVNETVRPTLEKSGQIQITHVTNAQHAIERLSEREHDYCLLDLAIPLSADTNDAPALVHGEMVYRHIRRQFPGMPILILTGQRTDELAEGLIDEPEMTHFWDGDEHNLLALRDKKRLHQARDLLLSAAESLRTLNEIELDINPADQAGRLHLYEKRILRLFCRFVPDGVAVRGLILGGGLSSATVLNTEVLNKQGNAIAHAVAKIALKHVIDKEEINYRNYVSRLDMASFPPLLAVYYGGAGDLAGIFYSLAVKYIRNVFDVVDKGGHIQAVLQSTRTILKPWHAHKEGVHGTIREIRCSLMSDEEFTNVAQHLDGINVEAFERNRIQYNTCVSHKDLHGGNILVAENDSPVVIDYGDIANAPSCLDPITLELSCIFHASRVGKWKPTEEQISNWFDVRMFSEISPFPEFINMTRQWAIDQAFMQNEILAVVYTYAVRQLKYEDTDKQLAKILIQATVARFAER